MTFHKYLGDSKMFEYDKLLTLKKAELVELIMELQKEKISLKYVIKNSSSLEERISNLEKSNIELERSHYLYLQYGRRNLVEISGIPTAIETKDLEDHVIQIYKEAKVEVNGHQLTHFDIQACHRIGKKGDTVVRFVNRKFAYEGLYKENISKVTNFIKLLEILLLSTLTIAFVYHFSS